MSTKAIIFSAPSGSGKTTIVQHLIKALPNLQFSISATTRKPRGQEIEGEDYYFLNTEDFNEEIREENFLEWEEVYAGIKYGTLRKEVDRIWNEGKSVIFDVDVVGGLNLKNQLGERALAIFIQAPSIEILRERLALRSTESEDALNKRIEKAAEEMEFAPRFDRIIVNGDLNEAKSEAMEIVSKFLME